MSTSVVHPPILVLLSTALANFQEWNEWFLLAIIAFKMAATAILDDMASPLSESNPPRIASNCILTPVNPLALNIIRTAKAALLPLVLLNCVVIYVTLTPCHK